jgi:hypothetical protein
MTKKIVKRYYEPLSDEEREEIKILLTPIYEEKERWDIATELRNAILGCIRETISNPKTHFNKDNKNQATDLNRSIKEKCDDWYTKYASRLGSDILPDHIRVTVSVDGLYILGYTDVLKDIITKADFELKTFVSNLPQKDWELIVQANEVLEKESIK